MLRFRFPFHSGIVAVCLILAVGLSTTIHAEIPEEKGELAAQAVPATYRFEGPVGARIQANVDGWLTVAPRNNPGLLDMFARRDSGQPPDLVPWAGEFVGKYLISGVQALRMNDDAKLKPILEDVVRRLLALQDDDGYLGPWPRQERLRGHWDLWGHYHIMLGLLMWHEQTGDEDAFQAARRIGDLVCRTFLDTELRVIDAGSHEMNMAVIHGLGRLYRETGEPRYLQMCREVLIDFERAGDYYRQGLQGREFHRTPRPRWESLHCLQGLVELYRITGDESFRRSFLHHWASIRRFDQRNTGGFSSGEQATGNPFANRAIETCCVVAWQEIMMDALELTADPTIADDLELSTFNAMLGAQHPSGAWCTYDTPMNGRRIPSHVHINFQARPDTPHLNCCSVNGPRGYGSLSRWAVMQSRHRVLVNYYGPLQAEWTNRDGHRVAIRQETDYPRDGDILLRIETGRLESLALRIPAWAANARLAVNNEPARQVPPGRYATVDRPLTSGDRVRISLNMQVRYAVGDLDQADRVSLYRGPLLLAADSRDATGELAAVAVRELSAAKVVDVDNNSDGPWIAVDVPTTDGNRLRLIDFASAGQTTVAGQPESDYTTWLLAGPLPPPPPVAWKPADGQIVGPGAIRFVWRSPPAQATETRRHKIVIADSSSFEKVAVEYGDQSGGWLVLPPELASQLQPHTPYFWKVVATNALGSGESIPPFKRFRVDPAAPPLTNHWPYGQREADQMIVAATLRGDVKPEYGVLVDARGWKPAPGPGDQEHGAIETDGRQGLIRYRLLTFPERQFTAALWVNVVQLPTTHYGQIFSAWCAGMDDPLRIVVSEGKLSARIEAGRFYGTDGVSVEPGVWQHVAAVKDGTKLTLYINGKARAATEAPERVISAAEDFALGGNPHFSGAEYLAARLADFRFYARALSAAELRELANPDLNEAPSR